jgi:methyl-accepting chemotaxis protein
MNDNIEIIKKVKPNSVFNWFLVFFILDPLIFGIMMTLMLGSEKFIEISKILVILAPPILTAIAVYLFMVSRKGETIVRSLSSADSTQIKNAELFFNSYPSKFAFLFFAGNSGGPVLVGILGLSAGIISSWESAIYFALTGLFEAVIFSFLLYYIARIELFHLKEVIKFEPLSLFMKISVPIIALMMGLMLVLNVTIYKVMYSSLIKSSSSHMVQSLNNSVTESTRYFIETVNKLETAIIAGGYSSISSEMIETVLKRLRKSEGNNIEVFFGGDSYGNTVTDNGKLVNVSDREYFIKMKSDKKTSFSEIIESRATGVKVIVAAVPLINNGSITGFLGATITLDSANSFIKQISSEGSVEYILYTSDGKIIASTDTTLNEKSFKKDFTDDGKVNRNISSFVLQQEKISDVRINGVDYMTMSAPVPLLNGKLAMLVRQNVFFSDIDRMIFTLSIMLLIIFILIMALLFSVAYKIAAPIKEIILLLSNVASGDFSSTFERVIKDELANLADALNGSIRNIRNMLSTIISATENLSSVIEEISSGNQNLAQRTAEQASALEEIASSMEEATASINQNAENSEIARLMVESGAQKSEESNIISHDAVVSINEMSRSSKKISDITSLINEIAFQTNLLALNAAVEAARAGDQGRGFAVVASEVRNLAQRSGSAAKDIETLVRSAIEDVDTAAKLVERTGVVLSEISKKSVETVKVIAEITSAGFEQKEGMNQINLAVNELDRMTQQNAAMVEEIASSSEEMNAQAAELKDLIGQFKI